MDYFEKTIRSETVYVGNVVTVKKDTVILPNGKEATRDIVEHPGGVSIVAFTDKGKILLVRQFRKPLDIELWEIPAGKLAKGEDPLECAKRELEEETGFKALEIELLGKFYLTPGFCNEAHYIYYAKKLEKGTVNLDEDEFLCSKEFDKDEVLKQILNNEIKDTKTCLGLLVAINKHNI